jgi:hypothetical protein
MKRSIIPAESTTSGSNDTPIEVANAAIRPAANNHALALATLPGLAMAVTVWAKTAASGPIPTGR